MMIRRWAESYKTIDTICVFVNDAQSYITPTQSLFQTALADTVPLFLFTRLYFLAPSASVYFFRMRIYAALNPPVQRNQ